MIRGWRSVWMTCSISRGRCWPPWAARWEPRFRSCRRMPSWSRRSCCPRSSSPSTPAGSRASVSRPAGLRPTSRFWPRQWAYRRWSRSGRQCGGSWKGRRLLLDAEGGLLHVDPGAERLAAARRQLELTGRAPRRGAGGRATGLLHGRRRAHRGVCQHRLARGSAGGRAQRRGRMRPAADGVPVPRAGDAPERGGAACGVSTARRGARGQAR